MKSPISQELKYTIILVFILLVLSTLASYGRPSFYDSLIAFWVISIYFSNHFDYQEVNLTQFMTLFGVFADVVYLYLYSSWNLSDKQTENVQEVASVVSFTYNWMILFSWIGLLVKFPLIYFLKIVADNLIYLNQ